jgi:carboxymethylenebutenolidase
MDYLQRYLVEEMIEDYREGRYPRREMIRRVLLITGSIPMTASLLLAAGCGSAPAASPTQAAATTAPVRAAAPTSAPTAAPPAAATATSAPAGAAPTSAPTGAAATSGATAVATPATVIISPTDPAIDAGPVEFPSQSIVVKGYRSAPKGATKAPGIIVIHENTGLTEHIKDMTRRYAKAGYLAVAPDLVSRQGGTDKFTDSAQIAGILGQANRQDLIQDMLSAVTFLKGLPNFAGPKAGAVGYCFGGGLTWQLAINSPDLAAAIPYYGPPPQPMDDVQKVTAAVLAFYGEADTRITSNVPAFEAAMKQYNKTFEYKIYPGATHAFNRDRSTAANAAAATDAYQRSLDWFAKYLKV